MEDEFTAAACKMTGIDQEELLPRTLQDFRMEVRPAVAPKEVRG